MTSRSMTRTVAESVIRRACRRLPGDMRDERYREWTAELPAILQDPDVGPALRAVKTLRYAVGAYRSSRRLRPTGTDSTSAAGAAGLSGTWADRSRRHVLTKPRLPDGTRFAVAAVITWFTLVFTRPAPPRGALNILFVAAVFMPDLLAVIAGIRFVRWLRQRKRHAPPQ